MVTKALAAVALTVLLAGPARAEVRCGWLENPTPANWSLVDRTGSWTLSEQGSPQPEGFDKIPDITKHDFVATNGSYGYACACLDADFGSDKAAHSIKTVSQMPLTRCKADHGLPRP